MRGVAAGAFAVRGTLKRPTFAGAVKWTRGSMRIVPTGMFVHDIAASVRMERDTIFVDSIAGVSGRGPVTLTGRMYVGSWRDPAVFAFADTAVLYDRELFPTSNALLANMRIDVDVSVNRNTWLRSRDMNIEMYTEEPVRVHREADALALTGVVSTDRGEYTFLSKSFQIKRGSATFVGGPELNPTLQATGEYQVQLANRPNFNIRVLIGGTAK